MLNLPENILNTVHRRILEEVSQKEIEREIRELVKAENEIRASQNFALIHLPETR